MVANPLDTMKTLLTTNWNNTNTDTITPTIAKKYEKPKDYNLQSGEDLIFVYSINTGLKPVGIGMPTYADVIESVRIDIRTRPNKTTNGLTDDTHARKVLDEVMRILKNNILSPGTGFKVLDQNIDYEDSSASHIGIFRYVINVRLVDYTRSY